MQKQITRPIRAIMSLLFPSLASGESNIVNSIGQEFVRIDAGSYQRGSKAGTFDELPIREVVISTPFLMSTTEVTNAQYEQFDPEHNRQRGDRGLSYYDNDAVINVSWHDAVAFCEWLSEKEGKPYRLPTESEWEFACRAGTETEFSTGDSLPYGVCERVEERYSGTPPDIESASLRVAKNGPNAWGLYDMHGNVEEWCLDWYGPYPTGRHPLTDPAGYKTGTMKVTRGGSHNTFPQYLRSANRSGLLPEDRTYLTGFRVVQADPPPAPDLEQPVPIWAENVLQTPHDWSKSPDPEKPFFTGPLPFVDRSKGPWGSGRFRHNHSPQITWLPNGDLLAIWFSTFDERGRELTILGSRLRAGQENFDPAWEFFKAPDRNMHGKALFTDEETGRIIHVNAIEAAGEHENLILVMRESMDNGATWTHPEIIHRFRGNHTVADNMMFRSKEGYLFQPCDLYWKGTSLFMSKDDGKTWEESTQLGWKSTESGEELQGFIKGIHGAVAQLDSGQLMAFGRDNGLDDGLPLKPMDSRMPMSLSSDLGRSWSWQDSEFPGIGMTQRPALLRLREGPLVLFSFTDDYMRAENLKEPLRGLDVKGVDGQERKVFGLFAAVSYDDGKTCPVKRLITDGGPSREIESIRGKKFLMDETHAELGGYLTVAQSPDGIINLLSSNYLYRFNLAWLKDDPFKFATVSQSAKTTD